jgi:hypothetical protein
MIQNFLVVLLVHFYLMESKRDSYQSDVEELAK